MVALDYLAARKAVALIERHQVRDYIDVAYLVDAGYKIPQLLELGTGDPSLTRDDAGMAGSAQICRVQLRLLKASHGISVASNSPMAQKYRTMPGRWVISHDDSIDDK